MQQQSYSSYDPSSDPLQRPARILQVLPRLVTGGVERGTLDIAAALVEAGCEAIVASEGGPMTYELQRSGARHVELPLASKNPLRIWRNAARLAELIQGEGIDLVHARSRAPAWSAWLAARRAGVPFVTTFHGTYNAGSALKRHYNAIMTRGQRVIAVSQFIARHIVDNYYVDATRIRVIPRGVDLARFDPAVVSAERVIQLARAWQLPDGVPVVMLPGRLTRWKGQMLLVEALERLRDLDFCCVFVGSDQGREAYRKELEQAITDRGLGAKVFLRDDCKDMPAAYMLADVVVSASTDPEAFGRVVGEAQAMGRPVVASNHGGAPEQVVEGRTAYLFKPNDPEDLARAVAQAVRLSPDERARMARAAVEQGRRFSKDVMCQSTLSVYQELLDSRRISFAEEGHDGFAADASGEADAAALTGR